MNEQLSKRLAERFFGALTAEDVKGILGDEEGAFYFDDPGNWCSYGDREKNWDTVGNQQSNAVGAFVELLTNSIDSILLRKARELGITDPRGPSAPKTMQEAVKRFFPQIVEGKISNLSAKQRTDLAKECIQLAIQRGHRKNHPFPTYTVLDAGEGQLPEDFHSTFLSLGEKNKEGIPFVQGKFNMGSTGSLRFCTRSDIRLGHYKFIASRRAGHPYWAWTLIRVRPARKGESLPVAEFFSLGNKRSMPRFRADNVHAFGDETLGVISEGTAVKLFEYDIGSPARNVDFGLYNALMVNLIDSALPIVYYDFSAGEVKGKGELRARGIAQRTFSGLLTALRVGDVDSAESSAEQMSTGNVKSEFVHYIQLNDEELGRVDVYPVGVPRLEESLKNQPARVFYTVNGQTHAIERGSFFNLKLGLGELRNHLLVNVVCDSMDKLALATIFMPDRERKAANGLSRRLEQRLVELLKRDERLREFSSEIRRRRATEQIDDKGETAALLQDLVRADPAIRDLFGLGVLLPDVRQGSGGHEKFVGKKFPTFLKPLNLRVEKGVFVKEVPVGGVRRIDCGTDAENEYLTRIDSPGEVWCSVAPAQLPNTASLRNGMARFSISAPSTVVVGDQLTAAFGFVDVGPNISPLKFEVLVVFTPAEEPENRESGERSESKQKKKPAIGEPEFKWVRKDDWAEHSFSELDGAYVEHQDNGSIVWVNRDNKYLVALRAQQPDEAERLLNDNVFRIGLGLIALAIHKKATEAPPSIGEEASDEEASKRIDPEEQVRMSTAAMAAYIVPIIRRLGGSQAIR